MRAAVRLTAKIERRLKRFERELTRPIPRLTGFSRQERAVAVPRNVDIPSVRERVSFTRRAATNDNGGLSLDVVPAHAKAPPVLSPDRERRATAPAVMAEPREKPKTKKQSPGTAARTEAQTKAAPQDGGPVSLLFLATAAFSLSFLIVFKVVGHLA